MESCGIHIFSKQIWLNWLHWIRFDLHNGIASSRLCRLYCRAVLYMWIDKICKYFLSDKYKMRCSQFTINGTQYYALWHDTVFRGIFLQKWAFSVMWIKYSLNCPFICVHLWIWQTQFWISSSMIEATDWTLLNLTVSWEIYETFLRVMSSVLAKNAYLAKKE